MKVARYYSQKDIQYEDEPIPTIGEDEVLVKMKACGICGSDLMDWYLHDRAPLVLGHEPAGIIVKTGSKVQNFLEGDAVFVHHHVACLTCHYCIRGAYTLCDQFRQTHIYPGGFAEYFRVPAPNLHIDTLTLPKNVTFEEATLIEPIACCIKALNKSNFRQGDTVVVIGAGPSGIIHMMLLRNLGIGKIIMSDFIDYRLEKATLFGVDVVINPQKENFSKRIHEETDHNGADLVIVTAPSIPAILSGFKVCSKGGTVLIYAPTPPMDYLQLSPNDLLFSEITLLSSYSTSHVETRTALKLITSNRIRAKDLITHRYPIQQTGEAFKIAIENKESLKIVIVDDTDNS